MKILVFSHRFSPDIGGIETVSALLAGEFVNFGHEVRVITQTRAPDSRNWPFAVTRAPTPSRLLSEAAWCDVFFQNNISLNSLWAGLLLRKPLVVAHHTWIGGSMDAADGTSRLKRLLSRFFAVNVTVSDALAAHIGTPSTRIDNPYDDTTFRALPGSPCDLDLVYLGRLVSDKGVDLLLRALHLLRSDGLQPRLTIIGIGPDEAALRKLADELLPNGQISFEGSLTGEPLAKLLHRHKILVAPSRWPEPFGLVALEGIACGCVVVGSNAGGLPDAIGPCGLTFPNGDVAALAATLRRMLNEPRLVGQLRHGAEAHLAKHNPKTVARAYLALFERAVR